MRLQGAVLVLLGVALVAFAGARFLVERLDGSDPWTPAAILAAVGLVAGFALVAAGVRALARR